MSTVFVFFNSNYIRDSSHIVLETWHSPYTAFNMATARLSGLYNMTTPRKRAHCIHYLGISNAKLCTVVVLEHRRLCRVKNMLANYLKYHKAGLTPTTPVTSIAISPVKMSIGRKSLSNLRSEMIFLQGKPVFYIFLPSTPPY